MVISILEDYQKANSIKYDIDYHITFFNGDSINIDANVELIKDNRDSIFGGYLWFKANNGFSTYDKYYDLQTIYHIDHNTGFITTYDALNGEDFVINGNSDKAILNSHFFNSQGLINYIEKDSLGEIEINEVNLSDEELIELKIKSPDMPPYSNFSTVVYLDKKNRKIKEKITTVDFQLNTQKETYQFKNIEFNKVSINKLEKRLQDISQEYPTSKFIMKSSEDYKLLANNTISPNISGKVLNSDLVFSLKEELKESKLMIVDFWYSSCYPCIKSIPSLNELYLKYNDSGLNVVGLNPFDSDMPKEKLNKFLRVNKMEYLNVLVDKDIVKDFKVNAYPTLYMIDKNQKIVYSKIGVIGGETFRELDSILNKNLK